MTISNLVWLRNIISGQQKLHKSQPFRDNDGNELSGKTLKVCPKITVDGLSREYIDAYDNSKQSCLHAIWMMATEYMMDASEMFISIIEKTHWSISPLFQTYKV